MNELKFGLLDEREIFDVFKDTQLDILKKYGLECAITDFSILLGGAVSSKHHIGESTRLEDRTGYWFSKRIDIHNSRCAVCTINSVGNHEWYYADQRFIGGRPALLSLSQISAIKIRNLNGIDEIEYGEYPQYVVSQDFSNLLEDAYKTGAVRETGKNYTTDSAVDDNITSFQKRKHVEYEYNGEKYIRFVGDLNCSGRILSDGTKVEFGKPYWVKVSPIKWLVDKKSNKALSKYIIFSGIRFNSSYVNEINFEDTEYYHFLNDVFAKEIIPSTLNKDIGPNDTLLNSIVKKDEISPYALYLLENTSHEDIKFLSNAVILNEVWEILGLPLNTLNFDIVRRFDAYKNKNELSAIISVLFGCTVEQAAAMLEICTKHNEYLTDTQKNNPDSSIESVRNYRRSLIEKELGIEIKCPNQDEFVTKI